jgi:hypothetical protein
MQLWKGAGRSFDLIAATVDASDQEKSCVTGNVRSAAEIARLGVASGRTGVRPNATCADATWNVRLTSIPAVAA